MAQHGLDPLLAVTAPPRFSESTAPADRERFSTALQSAVDERPARPASDEQETDAAPRTVTTDDADDDLRDDASKSADLEEAAAAPTEPGESNPSEQSEESEAATLTLSTTTVHAEQSPPLSTTTIVATPTEEGAPGPVVETATPLLPAEAIPEPQNSTAETDGRTAAASTQPIGDDLSSALPNDAPAASEFLPETTVAATTTDSPDLPTTALDNDAVVVGEGDLATPVAASDGQSAEGADQSQAPVAGSGSVPGERDAASPTDRNAESDEGPSRAVRTQVAQQPADQPATLADQVEGTPEADVDHSSASHDDPGVKPEAERTSPNQDVAASRPWSRIGASRAVHPAAEADPADPAATIDRPRFLQRISGAIEAADRRGGPIQVRLSPPELGSLRIELVMKHGTLAATLETETASARQVLLDNLPALRTRLAEQDIRVEQFDVDVRRDGRETADGGASDRKPGEQLPDRRPTRPSPGSSAAENEPADQGETIFSDGENLDVRI